MKSKSWMLRRAGALALGLTMSLGALAGGVSTPTEIGVGDAAATAGQDPVTMSFPVTRTGATNYDLYFRYHTADGEAVAGTDYTAASGTIVIPAGSASATIPVTIAPFTSTASDKTFSMLLDSVIG